MAKRFVVVEGNYTYPADPTSLRIIRDAGGLSQIPTEQREFLKFKDVGPGDDCSDMPDPALSIYMSRGWIKVVVEEDE
jgi:hypothetical protein